MSKDKDEIREQILAAAEKRIQQYGFNKTTMNEIAKDCNMSAANIYRFFDSKNEIATELALQSFFEAEKLLKAITRNPELSPVDKLKAFTLEKLRMNYQMFNHQPNCFEIVNYIIDERDDLIEQHKETARSYLAEVLAEGNRDGLFDIDDIFAMADTLLKAVTLFYCPVLINMYTLEEMEHSAVEVVELLVKGLEKR